MINRRQTIQLSVSLLASPLLGWSSGAVAGQLALIQRRIPSSGELVPVIGMGTSRTFDTSITAESIASLTRVMQAFFNGGGKVIDSSPMYGNAETRIGDVLRTIQNPPPVFAATKVWTSGKARGIAQMEESARRMDVNKFDLIAIHNLKDWKTQLGTLKLWKEEGKLRYIGITTSHGRNHADLIDVMRREPLDFVQFSYNIKDREAEQVLLPLAHDRGIATMINRPYQRGALFAKAHDRALPELASELDCNSWGQFYLKFILGHPAVTCVIPATSSVEHMTDNMQANLGPVPDATQRAEMLKIFESM